MTTEHKYTVAEIDRMRQSVRTMLTMYAGIYADREGKDETSVNIAAAVGPGWRSDDLAKAVEEQLRTYMLAGISPEELAKAAQDHLYGR